MPETISFRQALERAPAKRQVLLGNGFSRACRDDIFAYEELFGRADFAEFSPSARNAFTALNTHDFEVVIRALLQAAALADVYLEDNGALSRRLLMDAAALRDLLVRTIAGSHPARPHDIAQERYVACRRFLRNFDHIYTVNYDLLLYWALMQQELEPEIRFDDGFRQPDDGPAEYVTWDVQKTENQNVFYVHGALHIFDAGSELQKFTWVNTGIALIDQIREALATGRFPLFVAEGSHASKLDRIQHSGYLNRAYRSLAKIGGALFVFGLSFADGDGHILNLIAKGKVTHVFVSLHGDPDSEGNARISTKVDAIRDRRPRRYPLAVEYFDADSANVWG
jgi:hypothetical protein